MKGNYRVIAWPWHGASHPLLLVVGFMSIGWTATRLRYHLSGGSFPMKHYFDVPLGAAHLGMDAAQV
jgi:hypothetical protein